MFKEHPAQNCFGNCQTIETILRLFSPKCKEHNLPFTRSLIVSKPLSVVVGPSLQRGTLRPRKKGCLQVGILYGKGRPTWSLAASHTVFMFGSGFLCEAAEKDCDLNRPGRSNSAMSILRACTKCTGTWGVSRFSKNMLGKGSNRENTQERSHWGGGGEKQKTD